MAWLPLIDIHTHRYRADIDSRMSYRPTEPCLGEGLYSIGLHPYFEDDLTDASLELLIQRISNEREHIWAIGEAGLDKRSLCSMERQIHYLLHQIKLSESLGLPLIIHCVRAYNELIQLRRESRAQQEWIIHGFRRNEATARQLLNAGLSISFGEHYHPAALRLAHSMGRAYLETDESNTSIENIWQQAMLTIEER